MTGWVKDNGDDDDDHAGFGCVGGSLLALKPNIRPLPRASYFSHRAASVRSEGTAPLMRADILIGVFGEKTTSRDNEGPFTADRCILLGARSAEGTAKRDNPAAPAKVEDTVNSP